MDIYLHNSQPSHSNNGEQETSINSHGGNGNVGTPGHIELLGLDETSHSGNGGAVELDPSNHLLPCGKPTGTPNNELTLQTWLLSQDLRSYFQQNKIHWKQCHEYYII